MKNIFIVLFLFILYQNAIAQKYKWAKSIGGAIFDGTNGVFVTNNSIWATGEFQNTIQLGGQLLTASGSRDSWVARFDTAGNVVWATKSGGTQYERGYKIVVDNSEASYVIGHFYGTASFGNQISLVSQGQSDVFVAKYSSSGEIIWAKNMGGAAKDAGLGIAYDGQDMIYITGFFKQTAQFDTTNVVGAAHNLFVAKYDTSGNLIWLKHTPIGNNTEPLDISTDKNGNVWLTGFFFGTAQFGGNFNISASGSNSDIMVVSYDKQGNLRFARRFGSSGSDFGWGLQTDTNGFAYLTGSFLGNVLFTNTLLTSTVNNKLDAFVAQLDTNGNTVWAKKIGSGYDHVQGNAISVSKNNEIYVTGQYIGNTTFQGSTETLTYFDNYATFLAKYKQDGSIVWAIGGTGGSSAPTHLANYQNKLYVAGNFYATTPFGNNTLVSAGSQDGYLLSVEDTTSTIPTSVATYKSKNYNNLKIYPNPVKTDFFVESNCNYTQIQIYSATGQLVMQQNINEPTSKFYMLLPSYLKNGIYSLRLINEKQRTIEQKIFLLQR